MLLSASVGGMGIKVCEVGMVEGIAGMAETGTLISSSYEEMASRWVGLSWHDCFSGLT